MPEDLTYIYHDGCYKYTDVDFSSVKSSHIHLTAIPLEILKLSINRTMSKTDYVSERIGSQEPFDFVVIWGSFY